MGESKTNKLIVAKKIFFSMIIISSAVFVFAKTALVVRAISLESNTLAIVGPPGQEDVQKAREQATNKGDLISTKTNEVKNKIIGFLSPIFQKIEEKTTTKWVNSFEPWLKERWEDFVLFLNKDIIIK